MTDPKSSREPPSDALRLEVEILDSLAAQETPENGPVGEGLTLLVVDDDPELRSYIRRCVLGMGGPVDRVIAAANGLGALERLRGERPDLMICDALMPGMDGFELCAAVRADPELRWLPILLITGEMTHARARRRAVDAGADGVLAKPFNARRLREALEALLRSRAPPGQAALPPDPAVGTGEEGDPGT